jgi:uncharacterized membrane protein YcaP (DUF421 family)
MFPGWTVLGSIALRTSAIYVLIFVALRLSGKREVGQMTPFDLTLLLLLSNSVQNAMTGPDTSLTGGIVAAGVLLVLNFVLAETAGVNRRFRRVLQGSPTLLVHDGQFVTAHLAREHLTVDAVQQAMREHGIASVGDVSLAVLEVDGTISFLKYDDVLPGHQPHRTMKFLRKQQ